jgi:hypothetical protein
MSLRDMRAAAHLPISVADDPPLYAFARALLSTGLRRYGRYDLCGAGRLPALGPAIVAANHPTDFDPIILGLAFDRPLCFMTDVVQFRHSCSTAGSPVAEPAGPSGPCASRRPCASCASGGCGRRGRVPPGVRCGRRGQRRPRAGRRDACAGYGPASSRAATPAIVWMP